MDFSSSPTMESCSGLPSPAPSPTRTECSIPAEVDQSFNSSMCLSPDESAGFRSPTRGLSPSLPMSPSAKQSDYLSAAPMLTLKPRRPDPVPLQANLPFASSSSSRNPLSTLGSGRTFGRELSLNVTSQRSAVPLKATKSIGMMLPPAVPEKSAKRGGIPMQWTSSNEETGSGSAKLAFHPSLFRRETEPVLSPRSTTSIDENGMDIDSPAVRKPAIVPSPAPSNVSGMSGSPGLGSFFCDSPAAPTALPPAKRRSLVDSSPASPSSSPSAKRASFGLNRPMDKVASSSAALFGNNRSNTLGVRRAQPYKRPTLLPVPMASERTSSASSAYPILYGAKPAQASTGAFPRAGVAPMRRAFSVCDQPAMPEMSEDESEFENSPSMNGAHAEYARRYGNRVVPRADGSPNFKPMRSSFAANSQGVPCPPKKQSPYGPGGLPGFGDNEMDGKILPCHKVKEDGLVRITPDTLDDLLAGKYTDKMKRFHVLDCRFDYEYAGGHIDGAINVKSMDALDELLLQDQSGLHAAGGDSLPEPSRSGQLSSAEQVVLVFHCEFSAKRAPTFACHFRAKDRSMNAHSYPKIFFPEVYILEGGYCGFWKSRPARCSPQGYTPMDDPKHFVRRNSDLHDFRKFSRTKSFTYGETQNPPVAHRALPPCPQLAFAAASAAVGRRAGFTITEENDEQESSPSGPSGTEGHEDSPCARVAPPTLLPFGQPNQAAPIFGTAKARTMGRAAFTRVASYAGPARSDTFGGVPISAPAQKTLFSGLPR